MTVAVERRCEKCRRILGPSRPDRRFCSTVCRMAAYRARRQPIDEEPQTPSPELAEALARATREERLVALVAHAARTNWRAAAWILERRWPERWGRQPRARSAVEVPPPSEGDDLFREIDDLARRRRARPRTR